MRLELLRVSCLSCAFRVDRDTHIQAGYVMGDHNQTYKHNEFQVTRVVFVEKRRARSEAPR